MSPQPVKPSSNYLRKAFCVLSADRLLSQGREPNGSTSTPLLWSSLTIPSRILGSFMQISRHSDVSDTRGTSLRNCLLDYLLKLRIDWSARRFSMQSHGKDLSRTIADLEFASPARIFGWRMGSSGNCGQKPEFGWGRLPRSPAGRKRKLGDIDGLVFRNVDRETPISWSIRSISPGDRSRAPQVELTGAAREAIPRGSGRGRTAMTFTHSCGRDLSCRLPGRGMRWTCSWG